MARFTSVSGTLFRTLLQVLWATCVLFSPSSVHAGEVIDRVVASVNTTAITLSEFRERLAVVRRTLPGATEEEVLNSMINGVLMLEKARQMRLEGKNADDLIAEYVNIRIRSSVLIRDDEIDRYISQHQSELAQNRNAAVRAKVEELLTEQEVNRELEKHLRELRDGADIMIQLSGQE